MRGLFKVGMLLVVVATVIAVTWVFYIRRVEDRAEREAPGIGAPLEPQAPADSAAAAVVDTVGSVGGP